MSSTRWNCEELYLLLDDLCDETLSKSDSIRLNDILQDHPAARWEYLCYMAVHAGLGPTQRERRHEEAKESSARPSTPVALPSVATPFFLSVPAVLYSTVGVLLIVGLLIAWTGGLPRTDHVARSTPSRSEVVGRITGVADCKWADPVASSSLGLDVRVGDRYTLAAGLVEIAYKTGARVILQGPVSYEVDSKDGGYLSVGKLTARLEKRAEGKRQTSDSPLSSLHSPLFAIRTPSAVVTDLGTEFGVEVAHSGSTESHVFRGAIEVRVVGETANTAHVVVLRERESVRVEPGEPNKWTTPTVRRMVANPATFVRRIATSQRVPIEVFNTGVGLSEGAPDPHWQIIAVNNGNDPNFRPRSALVTSAHPLWLANDPGRSQWISAVGKSSDPVPNAVTYTFRTIFKLTAEQVKTATLCGSFVADRQVRSMHLNGQNVPLSAVESLHVLRKFLIDRGFVEGVNVLEIDVFNGNPDAPVECSPMGLRVEWEEVE